MEFVYSISQIHQELFLLLSILPSSFRAYYLVRMLREVAWIRARISGEDSEIPLYFWEGSEQDEMHSSYFHELGRREAQRSVADMSVDLAVANRECTLEISSLENRPHRLYFLEEHRSMLWQSHMADRKSSERHRSLRIRIRSRVYHRSHLRSLSVQYISEYDSQLLHQGVYEAFQSQRVS